MERRLQIFA